MGMASTKDSSGDNVMVGIVVLWSESFGQDQGLGLGSGIIETLRENGARKMVMMMLPQILMIM